MLFNKIVKSRKNNYFSLIRLYLTETLNYLTTLRTLILYYITKLIILINVNV